jgi:hypothetical protein
MMDLVQDARWNHSGKIHYPMVDSTRGSLMGSRIWLRMPTAYGPDGVEHPMPKYDIEQDATIVYSGDCAYVVVDSTDQLSDLVGNPDVRVLDSHEIRLVKEELPFPVPDSPGKAADKSTVGLGDILAWFLNKLGFVECEGCSRRKAILNRVVVWRR